MKKVFLSLIAVLTVLTLLCSAALPAFAAEENILVKSDNLSGDGKKIMRITGEYDAVKYTGDNSAFTGTVAFYKNAISTVIFDSPKSAFKMAYAINNTLTASETPYSLLRLCENISTLKLIGEGDVIISASNGTNVETLFVNDVVFENTSKQLIIDENTELVIGGGTAEAPVDSVIGYAITDINGNAVELQYDENGNLDINVPINNRYILKSDSANNSEAAVTEATVVETTAGETTTQGTASAISDGNSTIVIGIAAVAVIAVAAFAIVNAKKKKSA